MQESVDADMTDRQAMEAARAINAYYKNSFPDDSVAVLATIISKHMPPSVSVSELQELAATWEAWCPHNPTEFEAGVEQGKYTAAVELRRILRATPEPKP